MIFRRDPSPAPPRPRGPETPPPPQPPHCQNPVCQDPWLKMAFGGTVDPAYDPCGAGPIPATAGLGRRP